MKTVLKQITNENDNKYCSIGPIGACGKLFWNRVESHPQNQLHALSLQETQNQE